MDKSKTTPAATEPAPVAAVVDDFDSVFAEITAPDFKEPVAAPETPAPVTTPAPAPTDVTPVTPPLTTPEAAPVVPAPEGDDTDKADADRLAVALAKIEALEAAAAAAAKPADPPKTPTTPTEAVPEKPPEIQWYVPTDEEKEVLKAHEEQWPDISKAEAIRTKQAVYNAVQYMFTRVREVYDPVLDRFGA